MKPINNRGFSLVEMLVTIVILAIVGSAVFGFITVTGNFFDRTKKEVNTVTEAEDASNWLTDAISETARGISLRDESGSVRILEIYNEKNAYTVTYDKLAKVIYCDESALNADGNWVAVSAARSNVLAKNVKDFTVDISGAQSDTRTVLMNISVDDDGRSVTFNKTITIRNEVLVNGTEEQLRNIISEFKSTVTGVYIYPMVKYTTPGSDITFSARVTGVGFPSQTVIWSIADRTGLKSGTTIDATTGTLHVAADETNSFRVVATSVETDNQDRPVSSDNSCGLVELMTLTGIEITNKPTTPLTVGTVYGLKAIVKGSNMDTSAEKVVWSIPAGKEKEGLTISSNGVLTLGIGLYNAFPTADDKTGANVTVRASAAADPTKYVDLVVDLFFENGDFTFDSITYSVNRGSYINLSSELAYYGKTTENNKVIWSIKNDAGIGSKLKLDTSLGILTVDKDIDYAKTYTVKLQAIMYSSGTNEKVDEAEVNVMIPAVRLSLACDTVTVKKGESGRVPFEVTGLVVDAGDVISSSKPAIRNSLLYVEKGKLVISLGVDIKQDEFNAGIYINGFPTISDDLKVLVEERTNVTFAVNMEDAPIYVPVPGERSGPDPDTVKTAGYSTYVAGINIIYGYDAGRDRYTIRLGSSGSSYFYKDTAGTDVCWYLSNIESDTGSVFYAPTPGSKYFPESAAFTNVGGTDYAEATITYHEERIRYRRYNTNEYRWSTRTYTYQVYDEGTGNWYQYSDYCPYWMAPDNKYANVAFAKAYTNVGTEGALTPDLAIDQKSDTRWASEHGIDDAYLMVDMGCVRNISRIYLEWESARAKEYEIKVSNDGTHWTTVATFNDPDMGNIANRTNETYTTADFPGGNVARGRYVLMQGIHRNTEGYGYSIWAFDITTTNLN
ncbi:MAG: discoidin domain-containing protein [Acetatifactor sp.]|nr:discoidin domain-containing protein [Acetatifactor sp.]